MKWMSTDFSQRFSETPMCWLRFSWIVFIVFLIVLLLFQILPHWFTVVSLFTGFVIVVYMFDSFQCFIVSLFYWLPLLFFIVFFFSFLCGGQFFVLSWVLFVLSSRMGQTIDINTWFYPLHSFFMHVSVDQLFSCLFYASNQFFFRFFYA